jgi:hypothetical protein
VSKAKFSGQAQTSIEELSSGAQPQGPSVSILGKGEASLQQFWDSTVPPVLRQISVGDSVSLVVDAVVITPPEDLEYLTDVDGDFEADAVSVSRLRPCLPRVCRLAAAKLLVEVDTASNKKPARVFDLLKVDMVETVMFVLEMFGIMYSVAFSKQGNALQVRCLCCGIVRR